MFDLPLLLDRRYRIQVISLDGYDDGMQSGGCGVLEQVGAVLGVVIGVGMLLGRGACVLVRASTSCQLHPVGFEEGYSIPC
jgi:hypothetical protein